MRLLFDLKATQPNLSGKRHGGGKYGEIIFFRMIERGLKFDCFYDSTLWLNPDIKKICEENEITLFDTQKVGSILSIVKKYKIERIFSCIIYSCLGIEEINTTSCEVYGTFHGLRGLETPFDSFFYRYNNTFKERIKYTIKKMFYKVFYKKWHSEYLKYLNIPNIHLITVSEHTKYALLSYFPEIKGKEIPVFYSPNTSSKEFIKKSNSVEKYFLTVSGNRWEKNNLRVLIAFDKLVEMDYLNDFRMKVTGANQNTFHYKFKHPERFDFLGYVDEKELEKLYANAFVFCFPTLNEGFGYPPLEAMKYSVPVIASPFSSVAEICADGALYFNPFSVEEIMNRMMMLVFNRIIYKEYAKKGYEQYVKIKNKQDFDLDALIDILIGKRTY